MLIYLFFYIVSVHQEDTSALRNPFVCHLSSTYLYSLSAGFIVNHMRESPRQLWSRAMNPQVLRPVELLLGLGEYPIHYYTYSTNPLSEYRE